MITIDEAKIIEHMARTNVVLDSLDKRVGSIEEKVNKDSFWPKNAVGWITFIIITSTVLGIGYDTVIKLDDINTAVASTKSYINGQE